MGAFKQLVRAARRPDDTCDTPTYRVSRLYLATGADLCGYFSVLLRIVWLSSEMIYNFDFLLFLLPYSAFRRCTGLHSQSQSARSLSSPHPLNIANQKSKENTARHTGSHIQGRAKNGSATHCAGERWTRAPTVVCRWPSMSEALVCDTTRAIGIQRLRETLLLACLPEVFILNRSFHVVLLAVDGSLRTHLRTADIVLDAFAETPPPYHVVLLQNPLEPQRTANPRQHLKPPTPQLIQYRGGRRGIGWFLWRRPSVPSLRQAAWLRRECGCEHNRVTAAARRAEPSDLSWPSSRRANEQPDVVLLPATDKWATSRHPQSFPFLRSASWRWETSSGERLHPRPHHLGPASKHQTSQDCRNRH